MSDKSILSRREFLKAAILGIGGFISAAIGLPGLGYIAGPALNEDKTDAWIQLGPTSKIEPGTPSLFSARIERKTGWISNVEEILVYVYTEDGRAYAAMSNICTHLGCRVRWIENQEQFICPCHNGVFDKQGNVLAGPPPRPLDQYEVKVEQEQIFIKAG